MPNSSRRWFAPEVVQTSAMDCGPATLKCLLEGHGIPISYGRLREACQTDVDGTSIDTMEDVANQLGLDAEQVLLPPEHVLLPEARALPAIAVVTLPNNVTHFVVAWGELAGTVQVMDPGRGRRFVSRERFLDELYEFEMEVPAAGWRDWAGSSEARACFDRRLRELGLRGSEAARRVEAASEDASWRAFGVLDAATRAVAELREARALAGRRAARKLLDELLEDAAEREKDAPAVIPDRFWSVRPSEPEDTLRLRGAVLVRVTGSKTREEAPAPEELPPELRTALLEKPPRPGVELWRRLRADGVLSPLVLGAALFGAAGALVLEALLFRGLLEMGPYLNLSGQRLGFLGAVILFMALVLALELGIARGALRLGRKLEARLRLAFQGKVPKLSYSYFGSRLTSDMAERLHSIHTLRELSPLGSRLARSSFELILTAAGIAWLEPAAAPLALSAATLSIALPLCALPHLSERDLRVRNHLAGLSRFYLDALLGLVPIRLHGAARALMGEHEALLAEWSRARLHLQRSVVWLEGAQFVAGFGLATWLLLAHLDRGGELGVVLLLAYWALNIPVLGLEVVALGWRYPEHRNVMLRLLEPLDAPEEETGVSRVRRDSPPPSPTGPRTGVRLELAGVEVRAGGHRLLSDIDLSVAPGSHVAVVGLSGAGKSTLLGLFLGLRRPSTGTVRVDGEPLEGPPLTRLRAATAWVDPSVHLWNRTFLENLRYGGAELSESALETAIHLADLKPLLELLPEGHQTPLGEGGGLVSGGEGQRVRLGRALLRKEARLVLLDEPFRGLDRSARRELLSRARRFWKEATVFCVTHDLEATRDFDRVVVLEEGSLVESGAPEHLAASPGSRYRAMLDADARARSVFTSSSWRRLRLESGHLSSEEPR